MTDQERFGSKKLVLAADLGGTHLRVALVDESGKIHTHRKQGTPKDTDALGVVRALVAAARNCVKDKNIDASSVSSASIMIPGTINKSSQTVMQVPNLPCLDEVDLKAILEDELGWPVVLENDATQRLSGKCG